MAGITIFHSTDRSVKPRYMEEFRYTSSISLCESRFCYLSTSCVCECGMIHAMQKLKPSPIAQRV
ncbi:unnamed protein product [Fusarium graminearum]|uniref:Chromosome 2, complete genome n=1 Tax=Gibberella zeae (strain ATCC MYA-4620 / CBS 123657 / FGSC 9075 / NRRL 31084 / PH-1) TaxID=229533 RepID=A0A098DFE6_GIBZE|nr:unnamed protein product [Fusarium graminearum]